MSPSSITITITPQSPPVRSLANHLDAVMRFHLPQGDRRYGAPLESLAAGD
jgi:hypothetical protein